MKKKILSLISVGLSSIVFSMLFCAGLAEAITLNEASAACSALGGSMRYVVSGPKCDVANIYRASSSTDSRLKNSCSTLGGKITYDTFLKGYVCNLPNEIKVDGKSSSSSSSGGSSGKTNSTSKTNATNKKATSGTAESAKNRDLKAQESKSNNIGLDTGKTVADNATKSAKNSSNSGGGSKSPEAEDGEDAKTIEVNRDEYDNLNSCGGVSTSFISCDETDENALFSVLAMALTVMTYGVGAAAVLGVVITGYQYMTARDNSAQVMKAKNRLLQIVIGLAIWVVFWGVLQFLLPGGIFGNGGK